MDKIILHFLMFRNQIKLYHWKTKSYSKHKATDEFLSSFDAKTDQFVEEMIGKRDGNIKDNITIKFISLTDTNVKAYVVKFRNWVLEDLVELIEEDETNLLNLKDEIVGDLNKMIYLFRLK